MSGIDVFPLSRGPNADKLGYVGGWLITSYFGGRPNPFTGVPSNHGGMDLGAPTGTPMYAVKSGIIYQAWDPGGGGNWTRLQCDDGDMFGYGHASSYAPGGSGRRVKAGDLIAYVGSTGASTGAHLHFAYQPKGVYGYRDPYDLLMNCRNFAGSPITPIPDNGSGNDHPNPVPVPEEDIMATKAELEAVVNAAADRVVRAVEAAKPPPFDDGMWMGTHGGEGRIYIVINNVKYHVPGSTNPDPAQAQSENDSKIEVLNRLGFDNRGVQDQALANLPEAAFNITSV